ncbi:MAG TPA: hypothetical protein PLC52_08825 [Anaerolineales bacterium]|nr:hypothetical protein [Anaerolineales bacterium]HRQ92953.1 hypothetical protein [Anaerolineales bacterium]
MTFPSFILGATIATLFGAGFHLWRGGGMGRLLLYLGLAWGGFWGGHIIAQQASLTLFRLGPLYLGIAVLLSLAALFVGHWIFVVRPQ